MGKKKKKIKKEIKDLVIYRLGLLSPDKKIFIGSSGGFTKDELIKHVEKEDGIGEKITEIELAYLQAIKDGIFYEQDFSNYQTET